MNHKILEQIKGLGAFLAGDLPMSTSSYYYVSYYYVCYCYVYYYYVFYYYVYCYYVYHYYVYYYYVYHYYYIASMVRRVCAKEQASVHR
jgi:hypothetical protein